MNVAGEPAPNEPSAPPALSVTLKSFLAAARDAGSVAHEAIVAIGGELVAAGRVDKQVELFTLRLRLARQAAEKFARVLEHEEAAHEVAPGSINETRVSIAAVEAVYTMRDALGSAPSLGIQFSATCDQVSKRALDALDAAMTLAARHMDGGDDV